MAAQTTRNALNDLELAQELIARGSPKLFLDKLHECLNATKRFWNMAEKRWEIDPDYNCILGALKLGMPYAFGLPPTRSEVVNLTASVNLNQEAPISLENIKDGVLRDKVMSMLNNPEIMAEANRRAAAELARRVIEESKDGMKGQEAQGF